MNNLQRPNSGETRTLDRAKIHYLERKLILYFILENGSLPELNKQ